MNIREINLLFSEVVFTKILDYISDEELESINDSLKSIEYKSTDPNPNNKQATQVSKNKEIFKSLYFLKLAETIKEEFINFKNNTLHYVNDFKYTTSWSTKSQPNQQSEWHNHTNCFYSGIFYTNVSEDCGKLELNAFRQKGFLVQPSQYTDLNSPYYSIGAMNKMLIFFPSHLYHRIGFNNSNLTRYSIAFNFIPTGKIGYADSELKL
tara:strand:- start:319 stop:945 length:627 start_codon:yes stop_codon:yes gene_type:complete